MNKNKWDLAISEARKYILNYDYVRWRIVDLANECCIENLGQRAATGDFTYVRFAREINLDYKTLINWVRVKRNVFDKLTVKTRDSGFKIPLELLNRVSNKVDNSSTVKEVRKIFVEESGVDPNRLRFIKYIKHMKTILYNVQRPTRLVQIKDIDLAELIKLSNQITRLAGMEMQYRKKHNKPSGVERAEHIAGLIDHIERSV